jgi:hypothetical protein
LEQLRLELLVGRLRGLVETEVEIHGHVVRSRPVTWRRRWQVRHV